MSSRPVPPCRYVSSTSEAAAVAQPVETTTAAKPALMKKFQVYR